MNFGQAIEAIKSGKRVAREGWNGKGMWIALADVPAVKLQRPASDHVGCNLNGIRSCIVMWDAQKMLVPGWLASQTDMLAEDWTEVA